MDATSWTYSAPSCGAQKLPELVKGLLILTVSEAGSCVLTEPQTWNILARHEPWYVLPAQSRLAARQPRVTVFHISATMLDETGLQNVAVKVYRLQPFRNVG